MIRHYDAWGVWAVVVLFAGSLAWGQSTPASATHVGKRLPTLAVAVSSQGSNGHNRENLEDLLIIELANQPFLQIVDRQKLQTVLNEHAIAIGNLNDTKNALALGKFAGADYLLHVLAEKHNASVRLVEVAGGQVKLEEQVALTSDLALCSAAVREKVLAALRPDTRATSRLTVGIAAFTNRSGTDRSDKLGVELQKALRSRLRDEAWAVVLERQYPTELLEEFDLARAGLVGDKAVEKLPPADLVILGSMEDVGREYEPGTPWEVKLDLTLRLREHSRQVSQTLRSDAIEGAADDIMRKIGAFRRQPMAKAAVAEKELWRRQAMYLMPRANYAVGRGLHDCMAQRKKLDTIEMIRAWENVLLLDAGDLEAELNLGICLASLYLNDLESPDGPRKRLAVEQCLRGSRLAENAVRARPGRHEAVSFYFMAERLKTWLPERSAEMFDHIVAHPDVFPGEIKWARIALGGLRKDSLPKRIDDAVRNAAKDPGSVDAMVIRMQIAYSHSPDKVLEIAAKYTASDNPLVRFYFEWAIADTLYRQRDFAALEHFDRAIAVHEAAFAAYNSLTVDDIYRYKISACEFLKSPELLRRTALEGARHFMAIGRFNQSIQWLYFYCAMNVLTKKGDEKEALVICDTYLDATKRNPSLQNDYGPRIVERREELLAKLAGTLLPNLDSLRLAKGTEATNLHASRMAATDGRLWLAWQQWQSGGPALLYRCDLDQTRRLSNLPANIRAVVTSKDVVFFGGLDGLYKLDTNGKLLKHYCRKDDSLPADHVVDLCEGGGKIYLSYRNSDQYGVAMLDPATDRVSVLTPSSREANMATEPVYDVYRVWWDVVNSRLYASYYLRFASAVADVTHQFGWMQKGKAWQRYLDEDAPRLIVSDGDEALLVQIRGKQTEFRFLKAGKKVTAEVPLPWLMGEPAWDEHRIWAPTFTGLYEINRATGHVTWLAHKDDTPFLSLLKQGNRLYIATSRGLYCCDIPPFVATTVLSTSANVSDGGGK